VLFATVFTFGASTQNVLDCRNTISMLAQLSWVFVEKHRHKTLNITSQNKMFLWWTASDWNPSAEFIFQYNVYTEEWPEN